MTDLRVQYQFDGFGNPEDDLGIVIFEGKHLEVKEFVFEYNMNYWDKEMKKIFSEFEASWQNNPDADFYHDEWLNPKSNLRKKFPDVDHLRKYFQKHGSSWAKEVAKQAATAAKKKC